MKKQIIKESFAQDTLEWVSEYAKSIGCSMVLCFNGSAWNLSIVNETTVNFIAEGYNILNVLKIAEIRINKLLVAQKIREINQNHQS